MLLPLPRGGYRWGLVILSLYKGFKIRKTKGVRYSLNNKGGEIRKVELLISNF